MCVGLNIRGRFSKSRLRVFLFNKLKMNQMTKNNPSNEFPKPMLSGMVVGMAFGAVAGVIAGMLSGDLAVWLSVGIGAGMSSGIGIGAAIHQKNK